MTCVHCDLDCFEILLLLLCQVANMGGGEALLVDTLGRVITPSYHERVTLHEAGHFLVAYLVGLLPKDYTLSSLDAFARWVLFLALVM
jgi:hypothetical protein